MKADCWSHPVDLECIGQWSRSFSTYSVVSVDPEWWVSRRKWCRDNEVRDESRVLILPGWPWVHRPVISLLQHLSRCLQDPEWWVSRGRDAEVRVCDGSRLLISPWLIFQRIGQWARSFSTYLVASNIQSGECLEEEMHRCGCVMEADCWSHPVDFERIDQWARSFSTYLVASNMQSGECLEEEMHRWGEGWKQSVDPTWLTLSASASDLAPSAPIRWYPRSRVVSV